MAGQGLDCLTIGPGILHATCVAVNGRGVVITGPSGAGKSALGLQLLAMGARLVADDQVDLRPSEGHCVASRPVGLPPMIEARGVGLLGAPMAAETAVALVVDLAQVETHRLPPLRHAVLAGFPVDLVYGPCTPHLPAAIWLRCHHGRQE